MVSVEYIEYVRLSKEQLRLLFCNYAINTKFDVPEIHWYFNNIHGAINHYKIPFCVISKDQFRGNGDHTISYDDHLERFIKNIAKVLNNMQEPGNWASKTHFPSIENEHLRKRFTCIIDGWLYAFNVVQDFPDNGWNNEKVYLRVDYPWCHIFLLHIINKQLIRVYHGVSFRIFYYWFRPIFQKCCCLHLCIFLKIKASFKAILLTKVVFKSFWWKKTLRLEYVILHWLWIIQTMSKSILSFSTSTRNALKTLSPSNCI